MLRVVLEHTEDFTDSAYTSHENRERILELSKQAKMELEQLVSAWMYAVRFFFLCLAMLIASPPSWKEIYFQANSVYVIWNNVCNASNTLSQSNKYYKYNRNKNIVSLMLA